MSVFNIITGGIACDYIAGTPVGGSFGYRTQLTPGPDDGRVGDLVAGDADAVTKDILWVPPECPANVGVEDIGFSLGERSDVEVCA